MKSLPNHCRNAIGIDSKEPTATCAVVFDQMGDTRLLLANMNIHQTITSETVGRISSLCGRCYKNGTRN